MRTCEEIQAFLENNFKCVTGVDGNECLKRVELPIIRNTCASLDAFPSKQTTMLRIHTKEEVGSDTL